MNFRTTLILLAVLAGLGFVLFLTKGKDQSATTEQEDSAPARLFSFSASDVTGVTIAGDEGTIEFAKGTDGKWRLTKPVDAPANETEVSSLVSSLGSLTSQGQTDAGGENASTLGVDAPRFVVEAKTGDGKTSKLSIGARSATGGNVYVKREGQTKADVVSASLLDAVDKPLSEWRRAQLLDVSSSDVQAIRVATTQQSFTLEKTGPEAWRVAQPTSMPAEPSEASDMAMALTNLHAIDFVSERSDDLKRYGLDQPTMSVAYSTKAPTTQPSTTEPSMTTISFGRFDDVLKKNVFAMTSDHPGIVKVAAPSLDAFRKSSLDLRDRKLVSIDPDEASKITLKVIRSATTQPTSRPSQESEIVLAKAQTKPQPTTAPATSPTTNLTTTPTSAPASKWKIASQGDRDADDARVAELLSEFHPLRVEKYIASAGVSPVKPIASYNFTIETSQRTYELRFSQSETNKPLTGIFEGVAFEVAPFVAEKFDPAVFTKSPRAASPPPGQPPSVEQ